jgi:hypothetical protein
LPSFRIGSLNFLTGVADLTAGAGLFCDTFLSSPAFTPIIYKALGYLNDVEEGGATEFRDLNISVKPKKGSLLVWKNVLPGTTKVHPDSLHAGRPVTKGEKFAFNLWFRENKFV